MVGFAIADKLYPSNTRGFLFLILSEIYPEKVFNTLAVASAIPSIRPRA